MHFPKKRLNAEGTEGGHKEHRETGNQSVVIVP